MKTTRHKTIVKTISTIVAISITIVLLTLCLYACSSAPSQEKIASKCVRIHIRANSNSQEDQNVKLLVRDKITEYLQTRLADCKSKNDAVKVLFQEKSKLVEIANSTLYTNNFDYKTTISLKNEYFPQRQYDTYVFPEGNYDALIVYLGEGVGDNWWCVAFPPLCFLPNDGSGEKITYKSWVKEWLDKLLG